MKFLLWHIIQRVCWLIRYIIWTNTETLNVCCHLDHSNPIFLLHTLAHEWWATFRLWILQKYHQFRRSYKPCDLDLKNKYFVLFYFSSQCCITIPSLVAKRLNGSEHFSLHKTWTDRPTGQQMDMVNPVYPFPLPSCYDDNSRVCNIC